MITVPKNNFEEIRVALVEYHGHHLVDVRTFAEVGSAGDRRPTPKGISISVRHLPCLIAALLTLQNNGGAK